MKIKTTIKTILISLLFIFYIATCIKVIDITLENRADIDRIYRDFYGTCNQCHDGVTGLTPEEQEELLYKLLRGDL